MGLFSKKSQFSGLSEFGKDLPWNMAVSRVFRVTNFDRLNTKVKNGLAVQRNPIKPYGYLIAESHTLGAKIKLPIIHRDDFGLAASVFDVPNLVKFVSDEELLVTYAPLELLPDGRTGSPHHVLHYAMAPRGTLNAYYTMNDGLHEKEPNPKILFGEFAYSGEIAVRPVVADITANPGI